MIHVLCLVGILSFSSPILAEPKFAYEYKSQVEAGAKAFAQSCYSCHSMSYMRTDAISLDAGIDPEQAPQWDPSSWMGHPPPDLSLVTAYRGIDYVYSYLRGYYVNADHPSGYDNIVMPGTQMPNPFPTMQGDQVLLTTQVEDKHLFEVLALESKGTMSPQAFEDYVTSIVAYLEYASDPSVETRHAYAPWVLGFLAVFIFLMVMLDLAYWRDIHQSHQDDQ